ncbi:MAG: sulfotransferase [Actinomycetota bacterium]|nr:sulfotransferase [Actinomycetota bacterium]
MTRPPTFLLGAGCQKGGTTWLYRYLKASPQFAAGYRKEYHVFDTLDVPAQTYMRNRIFDLAEEAIANARRGDSVDAAVLHRMSMYADPRFYFDYFATLLHQKPAATLTADMTPENALLSPERLRSIRDGFAERGVRTASVFLMRDPVDRVWSQIRMQHHRTPERFSESAEESLLRLHAEESYDSRTRYDAIVQRLDSVFDADDVAYAFYEELFDPDQIRRICSILGIDYHEPDLGRRANASPEPPAELPEETARHVAQHYGDVYRFVQDRFDADLARIWPFSRYVL